MAVTFKPLHPLLAAEAGGVDLSKPLAAAQVQEIVAGMDQYAVLVFRGQELDEDQQIAYAKQFGPLDLGLRKMKKGQPHRFRHDELADISNVQVDGKVAARDHAKIVNNIANQLWHSDSSFQKPAARYSMLHSVVIPDKGGETEFADLRSAYDALADDLKEEVAGLEAEHYVLHSRFMLGDTGYTDAQKVAIPPAVWPLVRTHAGSRRKLLWVGIHATHIVGMTLPEGRMLLMDLLEHATQRQFVYQHHWQVGDLVMWDNRAVLHRGRRFDLSQRREMRRATTEDVEESVI
ncbi:MAG: TauD/TfdA family dioxygenase [Candidatus Parcubacteria bacterium]|nr:TauD/TfdA family dioxygenase [Burkholderiales bacterium]